LSEKSIFFAGAPIAERYSNYRKLRKRVTFEFGLYTLTLLFGGPNLVD